MVIALPSTLINRHAKEKARVKIPAITLLKLGIDLIIFHRINHKIIQLLN